MPYLIVEIRQRREVYVPAQRHSCKRRNLILAVRYKADMPDRPACAGPTHRGTTSRFLLVTLEQDNLAMWKRYFDSRLVVRFFDLLGNRVQQAEK